MKLQITEENPDAEQFIPPNAPDNSGIGVNYADAYIKPINTETTDGLQISCKRKGLKIMLSIGDNSGEAIMRRVDHGPDVRNILRKALESAAMDAGSKFTVEEGVICVEV